MNCLHLSLIFHLLDFAIILDAMALIKNNNNLMKAKFCKKINLNNNNKMKLMKH